ncbi:MAG: hypothetical protein ACRDRI_22485 [Pseudonocardiaceae bacterium]
MTRKVRERDSGRVRKAGRAWTVEQWLTHWLDNIWDNFYNEVAPARALHALVGDQGDVPAALSNKFVRTIVKTFLGNGSGVSNAALPSYTSMLQALGPSQAGRALRAFTDPGISSLLRTSTGRRQWTSLLKVLEPKLTRPADRALHDAIQSSVSTGQRGGQGRGRTVDLPIFRTPVQCPRPVGTVHDVHRSSLATAGGRP